MATTGTLGKSGELDWLKVTLTANRTYEFPATGLTELTSIEVGTAATGIVTVVGGLP